MHSWRAVEGEWGEYGRLGVIRQAFAGGRMPLQPLRIPKIPAAGGTGLALPPDLCQQARAEELRYFHDKGVWAIKRINECLRRIGKPPISVRWVETSKGDDDNPNIRSRLVA